MTRRVGGGQRREGWDAYLDADERIVWTGRPAAGLRFKSSSLLMSAFGAAFFGFAIFWSFAAAEMTSTVDGPFQYFPLFGLPFICVGAYLLIGQYFWDAFRRKRTAYAVSNKRAFIATNTFRKSLKTYPIAASTNLDYQPGDEASLFFATRSVRTKNGSRDVPIGFEFIDDGKGAYDALRAIQTAA